jgi:hypothetical protein
MARRSGTGTMTGTRRYWNLFRQSPSGRDQKRILNRAVTCPLCSKPLGTDRALYRAYTTFSESGMIAAHPGCADEHMRQLTERLMSGVNRTLRTLSRYDLP